MDPDPLVIADIVAVQNPLPARWRPNARFMVNLSGINMARQLTLYANRTAVVSDAMIPPIMLGWEVCENSLMDGTINAGANDYLLLAGDFGRG